MVEVNPSQRAGLEILQEIGELRADTPRKKIMRLSLPVAARVKDVLTWSEELLR